MATLNGGHYPILKPDYGNIRADIERLYDCNYSIFVLYDIKIHFQILMC